MNPRIAICFIGVVASVFGPFDFVTRPARGQDKGAPAQKIKILRDKLKEAQALVDAIENELTQIQQTKKGPAGFIKTLRIEAKLSEAGTPDLFMGFGISLRVDEKKQEEVNALVRTNKLALRNVVYARVSKLSKQDLAAARGQEKLREIIKTAFDEVLFAGSELSLIREVAIEDFKFQ